MRRFTIAIMALTGVAAAHAQQAQAPARAPQKQVSATPASRPRVGYAATPTPPNTVQVSRPVYYQPRYLTIGAPYVVLSDGSVAVNFGNGYERVLRACSTSNATGVSTTELGRDALGRIPDPPGIAALRPGARGQVAGTMPAQNVAACFNRDAQGQLQIVTR